MSAILLQITTESFDQSTISFQVPQKRVSHHYKNKMKKRQHLYDAGVSFIYNSKNSRTMCQYFVD
jgi:predicted XRE-type DNA-binding protein